MLEEGQRVRLRSLASLRNDTRVYMDSDGDIILNGKGLLLVTTDERKFLGTELEFSHMEDSSEPKLYSFYSGEVDEYEDPKYVYFFDLVLEEVLDEP